MQPSVLIAKIRIQIVVPSKIACKRLNYNCFKERLAHFNGTVVMQDRNFSLDVIRAFAILFVVANHSIEMVYPFAGKDGNVEPFCCMPVIYQIFQFVIFTTGRLGVPLFFMLTGYLLVTRDFTTKDKIKKFYRKNFLGLILVWYAWVFIYNVFFLVFEQKPFDIKDIFLELLFVKKIPLMHTWYMKEIIIIYSFLPLLSNVVKKTSPIIFVVGILFISIVNSLFDGIYYLVFFVNKLMYIAYVIAGYYFAVFKTYPNRHSCLAFFIIGFVTIVGWQIYSYHNMNPTNVWYTNPLHYLVSLSLSSLLFRRNWEKGHFAPYIEWISRTSFGIFLLHVPIMKIIISIIPSLKDVEINNVLSLYCISFVSSSIIIMLITKIPIIGKTIFYIK